MSRDAFLIPFGGGVRIIMFYFVDWIGKDSFRTWQCKDRILPGLDSARTGFCHDRTLSGLDSARTVNCPAWTLPGLGWTPPWMD
jgi:hypothetical protein